MKVSRRRFLQAGGAVAAASLLPPALILGRSIAANAYDLTTLAATVVRGERLRQGSSGSYYRLTYGPGEAHILREELARKERQGIGRPLTHFAHFTDVQLIDAESPLRVEFLDRYNDPAADCETLIFAAAFRPHETMTLQVFEAMVRQVTSIRVSPMTGTPIQFAVATGDNADNQQLNEVRAFVDTFDGGMDVTLGSGSPLYEGVQAADWGDEEYWHPDAGVNDKWKQQWGFPNYPGLLADAVRAFRATGIGLPWYQTYGNHDGLIQGNFPRFFNMDAIAVSGAKPIGPPPGFNPCDSFQTLRDNAASLFQGPVRAVTPDARRQILHRNQYIAEMFRTTGSPVGHGFTDTNRRTGTMYWFSDEWPGFRLIGLDSVNPGGHDRGSMGQAQLAWMEERIKEVSSAYFDASGREVRTSNTDRYVLLLSHHGLRSMNAIFTNPDFLDPSGSDLPRRLGPEIEPIIHRYPNVIAWISGHHHANYIQPRRAAGRNGFWDIETASHIDFPYQVRLVEVLDNEDGTLSILCTMVEHAGTPVPSEGDLVLKLASISREVAFNDYQKDVPKIGESTAGFKDRPGDPSDRNVELVIKAPFRLSGSAAPGPRLADTR